jgi:peptidoglycan hydrolase-like protein with peptidoglycan-binding domain
MSSLALAPTFTRRRLRRPGRLTAHVLPALHPRVVQECLHALGHLDEVTGRFDRRTLDAVARFQAAAGLPVDGVPDADTADALLRAARPCRSPAPAR